MKTLSNKQCIKLLKKYNTPKRIFLHSRKVNAVAKFLAKHANKKGFNLNLRLIDNGSLLHDIEKFNSLKDDLCHAEEGEKTMIKEGFPEIANLVGFHVMERLFKLNKQLFSQQIVFYSDLRVTEDKIVSLKNRFSYLRKRYVPLSPKLSELYNIKSENKVLNLENNLLKKLNLNKNSINESSVKKYLISEKY